MTTQEIVSRLWNLCNVLRDDGITYHQYVTELTYILFLKMANETGAEGRFAEGIKLLKGENLTPEQIAENNEKQIILDYTWDTLQKKSGLELYKYYKDLLRLFGTYCTGRVREIYQGSMTNIDEPKNLEKIISSINDLDWFSAREEGLGNLYEGLLEKNANEKKSGAGQYFTPRVLIDVMTRMMKPQPRERCNDPACGTFGFMIAAHQFVKEQTDDFYELDAEQAAFEQKEAFTGCELVHDTHRLALMNAMLHDIDGKITLGDTLSNLGKSMQGYDLVLTNPPFGTAWGGKDAAEGVEDAVNTEYQKGFNGRWGAGLPGSGDMQMLFLQSAIDKMDDNYGRAAIVENGSPMFNGQTASGESQIRRWMLQNDLIEAIIALPNDLFYNTGIATYIWVLSKNKRAERKGKIQLIDATQIYHKLRKALGDKKNEISPEDRAAITKLYADFEENELCKIYNNEEFIYHEYTVMQPLQRSYAITEERIESMLSKGALSSLYDESKVSELEEAEELSGKDQKKLENFQNNKPVYDAIIETLRAAVSDSIYNSPSAFMPVLTKVLVLVTSDKKLLEKIADGLSVMDKNAEIQRDKKGNVLFDKETKDTEIVKYEERIEDYMAREVLPYVPDAVAFFEEDLSKKKPVIKTGAEIPFTRYFYKYQQPTASEELESHFMELELSVSERVAKLFD